MKYQKFLKHMFGKYLIVTNTLSGGILLATGDLIQQKIERVTIEGAAKYGNDWQRTRRLFTVGLALAPFCHIFYVYLDKVCSNNRLKNQ